MRSRVQNLSHIGWLVLYLSLGHCLGFGTQQRIAFPHLQDHRQQQHIQWNFKPKQECSPGFYRESNGLYKGRCVACSCNGNANRCLDGSGICINCQHNTAGDKCEYCKEGYFGDASQGNCRLCRCPYTNSFATGCVENGGEIQCFCKEGYTGVHCESCAPGYYGNPLKYGGYCQKCNCYDNGQLASCDRLTGECMSQEPKDTHTHEDCDSCDSCVVTLLNDLRTMGDELQLIKSQMQNINASSHTLAQMKHLEDRANKLKILLNGYRSTITAHGLKVDEIETDLFDLNQNINALKEKAENNYRKAETLLNNFSKTNQRGKDLISKIQSIVINVNVLLQQIAGTSGEGTLPLGDAAKELVQAQQMINEMRNRNFEQQLIEANKEKGKAQLLLDRVRSELQKHQGDNLRLIKIIRDSINEYESKLKDLHESLKEAKEQTKQAENLNRDNKLQLEDFKKRAEEMMKQQNDISDHLRSAEASFSQTSSLLELLQKRKEEYENLAAQLDGARKDLNEKLKSHSLSASKEPLVVRAEQHASSLQDLARKLENIKKNYSNDELVTCAIEAATAYGNIINAIKAAEAAANRAESAADSALSTVGKKDLAGRAKTLKSSSSNLLNQAQGAQKTLQEIRPALDNVKGRLEDVKLKKNMIEESLTTFQTNLDGINRGDIDFMIKSAKNMVNSANNVTSSILGELSPIKEDLEKLNGSYGTAQSADFNNILQDANNTVMKFTNILPDLFNKITSINEQLMPIGNVSENIDRIRELIQQARDAADKVAIPMRFNGSSGVEVRPPDILDDLKGYTSLSLYLQRPLSRLDSPRRQTSNMFVMYLGDKDSSKNYIGMAVRGGRLICAYNLGGNEAEVEVPEPVFESETKEATLDFVSFERIYQYAQLNYIKRATSSTPSSLEPFEFSIGSRHTLLNLDPDNVVFYVGGYPSDFRPPQVLDYPNYEGCIELDSLNERVISLYNFKRSFNLNTTEVQPCRRYREQSAKFYFEGTGYAHVIASPKGRTLRYEQSIQTTTDEGLIFFAENQDKFISLLIQNGYLVFRHKVDSQPPKEIKTQMTINDGVDHIVGLAINLSPSPNRITLTPRIEPVVLNMFPFDSYYLGGIPSSLRERFNISTPPFRGCMMNVKTSFESSPTFSESLGVSRKCPKDWKLVRTASFSKRGTLDLSDDGFPFPNDFQVGFGFRAVVLDGTLLNYNLRPDVFTVLLRNGSVIVSLSDGESLSVKASGDGSMHYVTVMKNDDTLTLMVDDVPQSTVVSTFERKTSQPIQFGGSDFEGCISNVFIQRSDQIPQVQNLTNHIRKTNVALGTCMIKKKAHPMLLQELRDDHHLKFLKGKKPIAFLTDAAIHQNSNTCPFQAHLNFVPGAYHFGNTPNTHLLFTVSQTSAEDRYHFAIDIRTSSPRGMVFFTGSNAGNRYTALYLSRGRFVFLLANDGRKIKIKSKAKYSDGQWHTVAFSRTEKKARLVVDGLKAQEENIPPSFSKSIESSIYLGGIPSLKAPNIPRKSFVGCLKNFNAGGKLVHSYHQNNGVLPCLDNSLEHGVSFFNEGGHIVIEKSFLMGLEYRIAFSIRPRSLTSILIHTGSKAVKYLTVYMENGVLTASGNNGAGEFLTSVTPQQSLCDGKWHFISVFQKRNIVYLEVDTRSNSTTGTSAVSSSSHAQPLYFGSIPVNVETPWLPVQDAFLGCLKDIAINDKPVLLSKISAVHGVVSLQGCPAN